MIPTDTVADIPVVVLAGGELVDLQGRLQPKACLRVAGEPMLGHVVSHYRRYGFRRFIVCSGTGHEDVAFEGNRLVRGPAFQQSHGVSLEIIFTGETAGTARRIREALRLLPEAGTIAVSYVDIVSDVDLAAVLATHRAENVAATLTAVNLPTRFKPLGVNLFSARVRGLAAKPITEDTLVSGGYYFLDPSRVVNVVPEWDSHESFEEHTLPRLAAAASLVYHKHDGYWQPIDSGRDVRMAERHLTECDA